MKKTHLLSLASVVFAILTTANAQEKPIFRYGGDIRLRQEIWDEIPLPTDNPSIARNGYNNSYRLRTRLYGSINVLNNLNLNLRAVNELHETPSGAEAYDWPDELVFDLINLELKDFLGNGSKLVLGRQEFILGSGRLIMDGTPLDGSRTSYMNGLLLHKPLSEDLSADIFAVYTSDEDDLAIGNLHRKLPGYSPAVDGRDEAAAGLFINSRSEKSKGSLYYIWKHETSAKKADGEKIDNADIHVIGAWIKPEFTDTISGEFEYAYEFDPNDENGIDASMAFAGLTYTHRWNHISTFFGINYEYLSGDDQTTDRNEAFNPILCRAPLISELVIYCYDSEGAGNWNNLHYPHLTMGFSEESGHNLTLTFGYMGAEENNSVGKGYNRGWLYTAHYGFPLFKGTKNGMGKTSGYVRLEILDPGDYYTSDRTAYFLRWQVSVAF